MILQQLPGFSHGAETLASEALQALGQALPCHVAQVQIAQTQGFLDMEIGNDLRKDLSMDPDGSGDLLVVMVVMVMMVMMRRRRILGVILSLEGESIKMYVVD